MTNDMHWEAFEQWYATHAFHYERNPIGSKLCGDQWASWQAAMRYRDELEKEKQA